MGLSRTEGVKQTITTAARRLLAPSRMPFYPDLPLSILGLNTYGDVLVKCEMRKQTRSAQSARADAGRCCTVQAALGVAVKALLTAAFLHKNKHVLVTERASGKMYEK